MNKTAQPIISSVDQVVYSEVIKTSIINNTYMQSFFQLIRKLLFTDWTQKYNPPSPNSQGNTCCIANGTQHEFCNCTVGANLDFCARACDKDLLCKGYVQNQEGYCKIATTGPCPTSNGCTKLNEGVNDDLDPNACTGASSSSAGCFIKKGSGLCIGKYFRQIVI